MTSKTTATVRRNLQLMDNNNNNNNNYMKNESHVEYNHIVVVYTRSNYIILDTIQHYSSSISYVIVFFVCVYNTTICVYPHYTLYAYVVDLILYRLSA